MKENILIEKSLTFATKIILLYKNINRSYLIIGNQILKSATSIGANINEANYAQSKADFISKLQISLKETAETEYWLKLLNNGKIISEQQFNELLNDCLEIKKLLVSSLNTAKK